MREGVRFYWEDEVKSLVLVIWVRDVLFRLKEKRVWVFYNSYRVVIWFFRFKLRKY